MMMMKYLYQFVMGNHGMKVVMVIPKASFDSLLNIFHVVVLVVLVDVLVVVVIVKTLFNKNIINIKLLLFELVMTWWY